MNPEKIIDYKGFKINIFSDDNAESPQSWENTDAFLIYDHRSFNVKVKGFDGQEIFTSIEERANKLKGRANAWFYEGYHIFPVYAYIHSGVSLSLGKSAYPFNCPWDTSMQGFVFVKQTKGWSYRREKAKVIALSVINEWNDYLSGNVWGFEITFTTNEDEENENTESLDSCWGYYGDYDQKNGLIDECKANIDSYIESNPEKYAIEQLELNFE